MKIEMIMPKMPSDKDIISILKELMLEQMKMDLKKYPNASVDWLEEAKTIPWFVSEEGAIKSNRCIVWIWFEDNNDLEMRFSLPFPENIGGTMKLVEV